MCADPNLSFRYIVHRCIGSGRCTAAAPTSDTQLLFTQSKLITAQLSCQKDILDLSVPSLSLTAVRRSLAICRP